MVSGRSLGYHKYAKECKLLHFLFFKPNVSLDFFCANGVETKRESGKKT